MNKLAFGDVIHVNGQPWPYLEVEPRKYRLRFLNTANYVPMIASDAGLLLNPVPTETLFISFAERWEAIFDFSPYAGKNVTLRNSRAVAADTDYNSTDKVMRFKVGNTVTDNSNNLPNGLPSKLRDVPFPSPREPIDHTFKFEHQNGKWEINGIVWSDINQRVLARPHRGAIEKCELQNGGGGWSHPIHIHLVDLQMTSRTGGRGDLMPYEKVALKDVMGLDTSETVDVIARYAPWDGVYMFHSHNLIHEDHEMLAAFNVSALSDLNYNDTTRFIDPMEPRYRAKPFQETDFQGHTGDFSDDAIAAKVAFFTSLDAYAHVEDAEDALSKYWATHTGGPEATVVTGAVSSVTSTTSKASTSTSTPKGTTTTSSTLITTTSSKVNGGGKSSTTTTTTKMKS